MEIIIEIQNNNVLPLLKELEKLQWIKLKQPSVRRTESLAQKFAGKLSDKTAEELHEHIAKSRNEWNRDI